MKHIRPNRVTTRPQDCAAPWPIRLFLSSAAAFGLWGCPNTEPAPNDAAVEVLIVSDARSPETGTDDGGRDAATDVPFHDTRQDVGPLPGSVGGEIRVDHFGWRPGDSKRAYVLGHANERAELYRVGEDSPTQTFTTGPAVDDEDSGDALSMIDFSEVTETGEYYLLLPDAALRSYTFLVADDVYDIVAVAAIKSFYYQRCNHDRVLPFASDTLLGFAGNGGEWVDGECHVEDHSAGPGPGSAEHGELDLHGGWHDAGDYQKTLWERGLEEMLFAYELNSGAFVDNQTNIPESGNGVPDLLDELAWELDFYLRMQRPDGHFMSSVKGSGATVTSPPSASDEGRVYFDSTSPSGGGWSGGDVTITEATANAVLALAHAAIVFAPADSDRADSYRSAALSGWGWLSASSPTTPKQRRLRVAAAAAIYRLDPSIMDAARLVDLVAWNTWDGLLPFSVTPAENTLTAAAWHILANESAPESLRARVRTAVGAAIVDRAFSEAGSYGGMFGGPTHTWDWGWGSNRAQALYGAHLMMAVHFGALGGENARNIRNRAQQHLHYLLGLNPLNMVYLSNMAAYGGEHSVFQLYHSWFSVSMQDADHGNTMYNGRPDSVHEPLYPYHPEDDATSTFGPAPGLLVGGPNHAYSCEYEIPGRSNPAYAYRDFSTGCDWSGSVCRACSWEITEPMGAYEGPLVLLSSFFMSR